VVCLWVTSEQFGESAGTASTSSISALALVVCLRLTSEQFGEAAGTASASSVSAFALVVCFRLTSGQFAAATSSASVASLALMVRRASVKISPMSVVLFLGQLLSITAEELG
jgi:hypothetical protein